MKLLVFYRPNTDYSRRTEEYMHDLQRLHDVDAKVIKVMDLSTRDSVAMASIYDIVSFPGLVVTDDFGGYIKGWSGELPLMSEVISYLHTAG